jgi:hypothetical protein
MRRILATPGILFYILAEGCCFALMFFRWLGTGSRERICVNWKEPYL